MENLIAILWSHIWLFISTHPYLIIMLPFLIFAWIMIPGKKYPDNSTYESYMRSVRKG